MKTQILKSVLLLATAWGLSACSGDIIPQDATEPSKAASVSLELQRKRVKRYDCAGQMTSDQIELYSSPTRLMELHPTRTSWTYNNISQSNFKDVQTGSVPSVYEFTKFTIDHGKGFLNMWVKTGINEIKYSFTFIDGVIEEGSRFIDVAYRETLLDGFDEFHPTPEECQAKPTPTPTP